MQSLKMQWGQAFGDSTMAPFKIPASPIAVPVPVSTPLPPIQLPVNAQPGKWR